MGFVFKGVDEIYKINSENKVRISFSAHALLIMAGDMVEFGIDRESTFVNAVFRNYRGEAMSSVSRYLQKHEDSLKKQLKLDESSKSLVIAQLMTMKEKELKEKIDEYGKRKEQGGIYRIDNDNCEYLKDECDECDYKKYYEKYYKYSVGKYVSSVIEEYCSLPFIKRERIYRRDVYKIVNDAIRYGKKLKVKVIKNLKDIRWFIVDPYKILSDSFDTQEYLVGYSSEQGDNKRDIASFSMARINPIMIEDAIKLDSDDIKLIEKRLSKENPAYILGESKEIEVKLTKKGVEQYKRRIYLRPDRTGEGKREGEYTIYKFYCSEMQIFNYFFSFGSEAEVINNDRLRNRFKNNYLDALKKYQGKK